MITSFAEVMAWLRGQARREPGLGRLQFLSEASGAPRAAVLLRDRARLAIAEAGRNPPEEFDVLILVGTHESLGSALARLPAHRVHALALPAPPPLLPRARESDQCPWLCLGALCH